MRRPFLTSVYLGYLKYSTLSGITLMLTHWLLLKKARFLQLGFIMIWPDISQNAEICK